VRIPPATHAVVVVKGDRCHAEQLREEVAAVLAPIGLRLSPEKTRVVHTSTTVSTSFSLHIRRIRKRGSAKLFVCTKPSKKAITSIKVRVATVTYRSNLRYV